MTELVSVIQISGVKKSTPRVVSSRWLVRVDEKNGVLIFVCPRVDEGREIGEKLITWAGVVIVLSEMTELLKLSSIACGHFLSRGSAYAVNANNIDMCVVFSIQAEMCPSAHSRRIGGGTMATTCPA